MFSLICKITIFPYNFDTVKEVRISRDLAQIVHTAEIDMPQSFVTEENKVFKFKDFLKPGKKITVELGYLFEDKRYIRREFEGYVKNVLLKEGFVTIECENAAYLLRKKVKNKILQNTSLKKILSYAITGISVSLVENIPDIFLDRFRIVDIRAIEVLNKLKEDYGFFSYFLDDNRLYCGLEQVQNSSNKNVEYDVGLDLIKSKSDFSLSPTNNQNLRVRAISIQQNNKRLIVEVGKKGGDFKTKYFKGINNRSELEELANNYLVEFERSQFSGYFSTSLQKYIRINDSVLLKNKGQNNMPEGYYRVKRIDTIFGQGGGSRKIFVDKKN